MKLSVTFVLFVTLKNIVCMEQAGDVPDGEEELNEASKQDVSGWIHHNDLLVNCQITDVKDVKKGKDNKGKKVKEITGYNVKLNTKTFMTRIDVDTNGDCGEFRKKFLTRACRRSEDNQVTDNTFSNMAALENFVTTCIDKEIYKDIMENVKMKYSNTVLEIKLTPVKPLQTGITRNIAETYETVYAQCFYIPILEKCFPASKKWFSSLTKIKIPKLSSSGNKKLKNG